MGLKEYKAKRRFKETPEPEGKEYNRKGALKFVIHKHDASRLHYDFRLEIDGVLKSWAVPKGPSMNPKDKRLAMMVEDHPIEYGKFEGIIPENNYGAGTVMVWDEGTFHAAKAEKREESEKELKRGIKEGNLKFFLRGKRLKGEFALIKVKSSTKGNEWLLIKKRDDFAMEEDILEIDTSVVSGRTLEKIKNESGEGKSVWISKEKATSEKEEIEKIGGKEAKMPQSPLPMFATLVEDPFDSKDWLFEVKWDGYRTIAEIKEGKANLYSRSFQPFNRHFPEVVESLSMLNIEAVLDGEVVVLDENGNPSFQMVQNYKGTSEGTLVYYIFDILYLNGRSLLDVPLLERKEILKSILPEIPYVKYNGHILKNGKDLFLEVSEKELEGIIAKRTQSIYEPGTRSKEWLKIKTHKRQEAVIAGYTDPKGARKYFGSLLLGIYEAGKLVYIGNAGGGFNDESLERVYNELVALEQIESPFDYGPTPKMPVHWVKPSLVCEVKFHEWTKDGIMRMPIFIDLRIDKKPKEVFREIEKPTLKVLSESRKPSVKTKPKVEKSKKSGKSVTKSTHRPTITRGGVVSSKPKILISPSSDDLHLDVENIDINQKKSEAIVKVNDNTLKLTNLKKIYWEEESYTKQDLLEYYDKVSPFLLPYLKNRPENLRRNPNGYKQKGFFQKDMPDTIPNWIETREVFSESKDEYINYMVCQNKASLLYMVNLGCIEINPWLSRIQSLNKPDYAVIDLDPDNVPFEEVIRVALAVKKVLDDAGIISFPKTSGSRGLHIYIPLGAKYDYEHARKFAEIIAVLTHKLVPDITSLLRSPSKRKNLIYIDYLQNRIGQTLAAPYCIRPRAGATVSTPLLWEEVKEGLHPSQFNIKNIFKRLNEKGDLFKGIFDRGTEIEKFIGQLKRKNRKK